MVTTQERVVFEMHLLTVLAASVLWLTSVCCAMSDGGYRRLPHSSLTACSAACRHDHRCESFTFNLRNLQCHLNDVQSAQNEAVIVPGIISRKPTQNNEVTDPCTVLSCSCDMSTCSVCRHCEVNPRTGTPFCVVVDKCGLALNKPATQSSTGRDAARAVDGDTNTNVAAGSCSSTSFGVDTKWWFVDLQTVHVVTSVFLTNSDDICANCLTNISIHVLYDVTKEDTASTLCANYPGSTGAGVTERVACVSPLHGRYLRITADNVYPALVLCEVDVCGSNTHCGLALNRRTDHSSKYVFATSSPVNDLESITFRLEQCDLALSGLAAQSPVHVFAPATVNVSESVEFRLQTCGLTAAGSNQWWSVDMRQTTYVTSISIENGEDCYGHLLSNLTMHVQQTASQALDADTVCSEAETFGTNLTETFVCPQNLIGRYVNITKASTEPLTLCEVDVCGVSMEALSVPCEANGYIRVGGTCIKLHNREVGGDTAHSTCKAEGARLLQIENHSTNTAIKTFLQSDAVLKIHSYYIGGRWSSSDAWFVWEDGTLVDYDDDWQAGYPKLGGRRCVILKHEFNLKWLDNRCLRQHWFICEATP
ncbi:uncharacterized protein LOC121377674 isoform X2 [Gigantopelta aegis]|uniref:uncharacterized protein LOC121377674 isoform X2 n=1 Tax=Gigantopelta aegis TaxID=1735272 RepID=UPI001B888D0B|nr:uncharacterized protein LOC121377674 isoform X2 [Gigantopelta aegis]